MNMQALIDSASRESLDGRDFMIALSPFSVDTNDERVWVRYVVFERINNFWDEIIHPTSKRVILTRLGRGR